MVILHVRVDGSEERFLVEGRCTDATRGVVERVSEAYALRLQLRELLALHRAPPADVAHVLSDAAVRAKQLVALDALAQLADRLATEVAAQGSVPPPAPPAADVCAALLFAKRELPRDDTSLSSFCGTANEKSQLTLTMVPGARGGARPLAEALRALAEAAPAHDVSLLAFVSGQAGGGRRGAGCARTARGARADGGGGDEEEEQPRLTSEHVERLWASRAVCGALRSESLRQTLARIDTAPDPERELDRALLDEHFAAFVNDMLVDTGIRDVDSAARVGLTD
ncbi:hypothetical protein KFE25_008656 [Diacronema lutheri]|uniref:Uncharacterized protein n=1 Tax=Diacronema lutheri TaxID=2081491 RepID=A0A8J5XYH0_DIALT|nr:hypothetical protein KFE25_008656 [Diacronema lutheri]